nr:MAG TPA: hypothetical protein [Caudoviricetes sp.]
MRRWAKERSLNLSARRGIRATSWRRGILKFL